MTPRFFRLTLDLQNVSLSDSTRRRYFRRPRTTHGPNKRFLSSFAQGSPLSRKEIFENSNHSLCSRIGGVNRPLRSRTASARARPQSQAQLNPAPKTFGVQRRRRNNFRFTSTRHRRLRRRKHKPLCPSNPSDRNPARDLHNHDHAISHVHIGQAASTATDSINANGELGPRLILTLQRRCGKSSPPRHQKRATTHPAQPSPPPAGQGRLARLDRAPTHSGTARDPPTAAHP